MKIVRHSLFPRTSFQRTALVMSSCLVPFLLGAIIGALNMVLMVVVTLWTLGRRAPGGEGGL